jgi:hypothetical protein
MKENVYCPVLLTKDKIVYKKPYRQIGEQALERREHGPVYVRSNASAKEHVKQLI